MNKPVEVFFYNRDQVLAMKEGDLAPTCFGDLKPIVKVNYRGDDINGRAFIGYETEFGPNSTISASLKEDTVVRTVPLSNMYTSAQIDTMEEKLRASLKAGDLKGIFEALQK